MPRMHRKQVTGGGKYAKKEALNTRFGANSCDTLDQCKFQGIFAGNDFKWKAQNRMRAGNELLFVSGAVGDCPIGVMQAVLNSRKYNFAFLHRRLLMRARCFVRKVYLRLAMCVRIHRGFAI